jgi:hypothetical protein
MTLFFANLVGFRRYESIMGCSFSKALTGFTICLCSMFGDLRGKRKTLGKEKANEKY